MKNTLIMLSLAFCMLLMGSTLAQEGTEAQATDSSVSSQSSETVSADNEDQSHNGIRVQLDMDDDLSTDEKFDEVTKAISEAFGEEFGKEMELEIEGLSDHEKAELLKSLEKGISINMNSDDIPLGALLVAVPAVVLFLGMPIFIVLLVLWFGHKKRRQKMELVNVYLEANKEVPPQVLNSFDVGAATSLRRGLMLTALGIGILAAFSAAGDSEIGALGLIPLFVGVARLIYWYVEERKA